MNIKVQCCGIVLLLIILYFYIRQRKLQLNTQKAFFRLLLISIAGVTLDVVSLVALKYHEQLPEILVDLICKSYISTLILTALCSVLYIFGDIYVDSARYRKASRIYGAVAFLGVALVFIEPIGKSYDDPERMYTYGPSVMTTYAFCLGLFTVTALFLIKRKKHMNIRRWEAVRTWLIFLVAAAVIQFFRNELLLVGYAGAIGIMIIYLKLENPETNLDRENSLFNRDAMQAYMKQLYGKGEDFAILGLIFTHSTERHISVEDEKQTSREVARYLLDIPDVCVFRCEEDEIFFVVS